ESLYAGALLSQIGEFSLVLAAVGLQAQLIMGFAYQTTVAVIALTLLISPTWVAAVKRLRRPPASAARLPVEP
ncbi:MAG: cation:proton antiporter, partial [Chloroflexota bacterium]|nr:cation:proton antiporter [Chloroflexota bacterium]